MGGRSTRKGVHVERIHFIVQRQPAQNLHFTQCKAIVLQFFFLKKAFLYVKEEPQTQWIISKKSFGGQLKNETKSPIFFPVFILHCGC